MPQTSQIVFYPALVTIKRSLLARIAIFVLHIIARLLHHLSSRVFRLINKNHRQVSLPPINNPILRQSACSLAEQIRSRQLSSEQVVSAFIERIEAVNPALNCVAETCFEEALSRARHVDETLGSASEEQRLQLARDKPFLGVPFTSKESIAARGYRLTLGLVARTHSRSDTNAICVQRMLDAGAILLARTNVPELCMWWETYNHIYGRTNNAYVRSRIAGGSSGGEGVLQAAAGSPMGIGADIGGSIRMPCYFNGIFGLKPTSLVVCNEGHYPMATGRLNEFLVIGPMVRYPEDLSAIYRVLAGPEHLSRLSLSPTSDICVQSVNYCYAQCAYNCRMVSPVSAEVVAAHTRLLAGMRERMRAQITHVHLEALDWQLEMWTNMMNSERRAPTFAQEMVDRAPDRSLSPLVELARVALRLSAHTLPAIILAFTQNTLMARTGELERRSFERLCESLRGQIVDMLGTHGVLLYPSHPTLAPYHNEPLFKVLNFVYTSVFNVLQLPVVQVPLGLSSEGLPLGVQLVTAPYCERVALAVADSLHRLGLAGWVPPN